MLPETTKPSHSATHGEKHKQLDREVREMVNAITHRITGSSHHEDEAEDEHGIRIITLAGTNTGATMRSELDDKSEPHGVPSLGEPEALSTYLNSNIQAVNNSIMLGSSYNTNDPGIHMEISDLFEQQGHKPNKHARKGTKDKEPVKSEQQTQHSD
ncbi:hypothetical protein CFOL_v3_34327 [Cephalotus follicularis]|uniref:Uncharacterized protein n=1 Tax=Cephalotus follicularis TaxID=3775 RepID=A0A1Q3DEM9_CEPFO|nr:hypothetical protein CFOL_v3_34327 [Cephalotus follicularis]